MIGKITRGQDMPGLVRYLTGPGRHEEHEQPRVIAVSEGISVPLGEQLQAGEIRSLATQLDTPRAVFGTDVAGGHVWHLSLTNRVDDLELSDEQWGEAAAVVMERLGFDDAARPVAPWAAIRHGRSNGGNDHVHVAVSLVREDGTKASIWQDRVKLSDACKELEERYGLLVVAGRTAGATPAPSRPEIEIAERTGRDEPDRVALARQVRAAASASRDEAEFVRRLRTGGVRARARYAKGDAQKVVGYSVALAGDDGGAPHRWWGGGNLAKDLRLPALRAGWDPIEVEAAAWEPAIVAGREVAEIGPEAWKAAARIAGEAAKQVPGGQGPGDSVALAQAARDGAGAAAALAARVEPGRPGPVAGLADSLARSAQAVDHRPPRRSALDGLATVAAQAALAAGGRSGSDLAGWLLLVAELIRLAQAIETAHRARGELHRAQELASRRQAIEQRYPQVTSVAGTTTPRVAGANRVAGPERPIAPPPQRDTDYGR